MTTIAFHLYSLTPLGGNFPDREGALLKVKFPDVGVGYADCHPWPELGDIVLSEHLRRLAAGEATALVRQSLSFAYIDAQARASRQNLFADIMIPVSHFVMTDISICKNIQSLPDHTLKIKTGIDKQREAYFLKQWSENKKSKLILDFNCRIHKKEFISFLKQSKDNLKAIEFIEDPFQYDPDEWQAIQEEFNVNLACDHESLTAIDYPNSCNVLVVKPGTQDAFSFAASELHGRQLVITSLLDHPIGQLGAAYIASKIVEKNKSLLKSTGLLSHLAYLPTSFSKRFNHEEGRLIPSTDGYGWGYDDLFEKLLWKELTPQSKFVVDWGIND